MTTSPQEAAGAYLAAVLADAKAKPADKLRAAEAILRADVRPAAGRRAARTMSDADLEATARGEGGTPPERGPANGVTETGPIRKGETPLAKGREPRAVDRARAAALAGSRTPNPLALAPTVVPNFKGKGGPKRVPSARSPVPAASPATRASADSPTDVDPLS